jgi:hypothetical protein
MGGWDGRWTSATPPPNIGGVSLPVAATRERKRSRMAVKKRSGKKGKTWYYYFSADGVRYRGVIPEARNKQEAEQAETKIRTDIVEGKYGGRRGFPPRRDQSDPH